MSFIKVVGGANIRIEGNTLFDLNRRDSVPPVPSGPPVKTTLYNPNGTINDTVSGDVPNDWKYFQLIPGYVDIGTSANAIGIYSFYGNKLTSVTIPSSVTSFGDYAFAFNDTLTSVDMKNSRVTSIGSYGFAYSQITSIDIPDSVTQIKQWAFGNTKLTSVTIPSGVVTTIGFQAFTGTTRLSAVNSYAPQSAFNRSNIFIGGGPGILFRVPSSGSASGTWTEGGPQTIGGRNNCFVVKNL